MRDDIRFYKSGLSLIRGDDNLNRALGELVHLAAQAGNSYASSLFLADWSQNVLKPAVTYGLSVAYVEACGSITIGDQCCGRAVHGQKPWIVSDMLNDPLFAVARSAALLSPIRAAFSVPIFDRKKECLGSLACHFSEVHNPTSEEIKRNETWAEMIAHVISQFSVTDAVKESPARVLEKSLDSGPVHL